MWMENKTVKFMILCFAMIMCVCLGWKIGSDTGTASGYEAGYAEGQKNPSDKTENSIYQKGYNAGFLAGSENDDKDKTYTEQYFDALNSQIVYVTRDGEKYHQKECQYLQNGCIEITLKTAKDLGYTPCSACW